MHNMGKTIGELHAMLIEYEKGLPKKAETPQLMMIKGCKIQKSKKKSLKAKGNGKANGKRNDKQLLKKKQVGSASSLGIFTIELFAFPNKSWVYDTGCGTHICITKQGFREARKLKQGALYLYVGNGVRAQVEAIGSYDLVLPNGLVICLDNCHYAPSITRGVVSVHRLVENGFVQCFTDFGISVSKNNVHYFNVIPSNGIYEIDMHDLVPNVNSIYNVSTKRAKHNLDSTYLWHCRLAHINVQDMCQDKVLATSLHSQMIIVVMVMFIFLNINMSFTPPYTPQHNDVSERRNRTLLDMVRSMMNLTTLPLSFWDYALESATRILNMVPTKKALVKRDTPDKLQQRSVKCIFIGYPKETMGYYFYFPPENKIVVARYAEFFEKNLITQEVSGRAIDLKEIQDEDTSPSEITSKIPMEVEGFEPPQEEVIPVRRSERTQRAPNRLCLNVEAEEHSLGDLNEPTSYKVTMLDSESNNYLDEDIYMVQPEGFVDPNHPRKVGFDQNIDEPCVYQKASGSNVTFLILYVDDIIIMGNHIPSLQSVKDYFGKCFAMKDLGKAAFILGIKIYKDRSKRLIGLSQNAYMDKILKRYKMDNSKHGHIPMQERLDLNKTQGASTPKEVKRMQNVPYASAVGSIMYAVIKQLMAIGEDLKMAKLLASAAICKNGGVTDWYQSHIIEKKVETLIITTFLFPSKKVLRAAISSEMLSPTLSLFHDDLYMKALQAFYTEKSPIPPPTIIPPSSIPNPQEFLSPKKQGRSSSSTSSLPQAFEIGESSRKTSIERHEEQIEEILNHAVARMPPKRTSTSEAPAMTQSAIRLVVIVSTCGLL
ncbi:retrotransposon protein, putative, ty1-copia subclass [Tanacetum coccineum]